MSAHSKSISSSSLASKPSTLAAGIGSHPGQARLLLVTPDDGLSSLIYDALKALPLILSRAYSLDEARALTGQKDMPLVLLHDGAPERQGDAALKRAEDQLRGLARRLLTIKDEEQISIAREIHDTLGQALAALKLDLLWIAKRLPDDQALQDKAQAMAGLIEESILSVREIVTRLRPDILEQMGLARALAHLVREFEGHSGIAADFHGDLGQAEPDWERGTALLRICQELLTNVARHAMASHVQVRLQSEGQHLSLQVEDDGKGITSADLHKPASLGLIGMRERVAPFGGHVMIESAGRGTHVCVVIPLEQPVPHADAASA